MIQRQPLVEVAVEFLEKNVRERSPVAQVTAVRHHASPEVT